MTSTALPDPTADLQAELDRLAARQLAGRGLLMRGVEAVGRLTEGAATTFLGLSPLSLEKVMESAFRQLYDPSRARRQDQCRARRAAGRQSGRRR